MDTRSWRWELDSTPDAVGEGRRLVRAVLADGTMTSAGVDDATMIVSELVTNAVVHGAAPVVLSLTEDDSGWQIRVHDGEHAGPRLRPNSLTAEGGRGLRLVATAGEGWGVDQDCSGKEVWVDLT